jgi:hypothetical protein
MKLELLSEIQSDFWAVIVRWILKKYFEILVKIDLEKGYFWIFIIFEVDFRLRNFYPIGYLYHTNSITYLDLH